MAMVKLAASGTLALFVAIAMVAASGVLALLVDMTVVLGSAKATTCPPHISLNCASFVLEPRKVPYNTCCIALQNNFQLLESTSSLERAINGVKLYNGSLAGLELSLALGLPQKCGLSGQYKKGQKCNGTIIPGGSWK